VASEGETARLFGEFRLRLPAGDGVLIARMAAGRRELALGARRDAVFGAVVMIGDGGVYLEALKDFRLLLPPFPVDTEYPTEIAGVKLTNYLDWMKSCYYITISSHPAISVPAGFTPAGLPVGLQIVGRHRDDVGVLQLAHAFERETQVWKRRPTFPSAGVP